MKEKEEQKKAMPELWAMAQDIWARIESDDIEEGSENEECLNWFDINEYADYRKRSIISYSDYDLTAYIGKDDEGDYYMTFADEDTDSYKVFFVDLKNAEEVMTAMLELAETMLDELKTDDKVLKELAKAIENCEDRSITVYRDDEWYNAMMDEKARGELEKMTGVINLRLEKLTIGADEYEITWEEE